MRKVKYDHVGKAMNMKQGVARLHVEFGVCALFFMWLVGMSTTALASPGYVAINGASGTLYGAGATSQPYTEPFNGGDLISLKATGGPGTFLDNSTIVLNLASSKGYCSSSGSQIYQAEGPIPRTIPYTIFSVSSGPTLTSVTPTTPAAGTPVTLTGTDFSDASAVNFGTQAATSFTVNSDTSITATAPADMIGDTVAVTVTTDAGTATATNVTYTFGFTMSALATSSFTFSNPANIVFGQSATTLVNFMEASGLKVYPTGSISYTITAGTTNGTIVAKGSAPITSAGIALATVPATLVVGSYALNITFVTDSTYAGTYSGDNDEDTMGQRQQQS